MKEDKNIRLNLYDYFGFPNDQQRKEARKNFDIGKLRLLTVNHADFSDDDTLIEKYRPWSNHINNFSSRLETHLLLMYYQYIQKPLDTISIEKFQTPEGASKIYFDTFAEDASLYLVSYFDKHLEMFNDLYNLHAQTENKKPPNRYKIIAKMKKKDELLDLANSYDTIAQSESFNQVKAIRDNFVHNKSSSFFGMNIRRNSTQGYTYYNSKGISTEKTYAAMCELVNNYGQLCEAVNTFFHTKMEETEQEA